MEASAEDCMLTEALFAQPLDDSGGLEGLEFSLETPFSSLSAGEFARLAAEAIPETAETAGTQEEATFSFFGEGGRRVGLIGGLGGLCGPSQTYRTMGPSAGLGPISI